MQTAPATPTPTRGVPLPLGGTQYWLRYSLATRKAVRQKFGGVENINDDNLGEILWFGLHASHPELTVEMVEDLVDGENYNDAVDALVKALTGKERKEIEALAAAKRAARPPAPPVEPSPTP